jgi:hypothetical protein
VNRSERIISSIAIFLLAIVCSPRPAPATEGWLDVAPADLAMKDNPKEPGADAMILYREDVVDASKTFSDGDSVEEYIRIKVFTQEGVKQGHVEIAFVKESEHVSYMVGRTIRPDGTFVKFDGQVLESTIEKRSGFKVLAKTFTLPDVQPGCIIEYKYQMQGQPHYVHDREWTVSQPMFTREAHFIYIPYTGYGGLGLTPHYRPYLLPADAALKEQVNGSYSMVVRDISGIAQETLMPPERPIESRVSFYYPAPDAPRDSDSTDHFWNQYGKKWDEDLEHFVDKKNALEAAISKIVSPGDAPETKLRKIYARVQQIRNLNMEDSKTEQETKNENLKPNSNVEDVLNRGYANEREVNYLFVGLARAAGFEATEVHIAPRNSEVFLPNIKQVNQLQADIVWVSAGSREYYLDPAARYYPFGLLPWYETETGGIRVDKRGATIVNTPVPASPDSTISRNANLEVKEDGTIAGTIEINFSGQGAALRREEQRKEDEAGRTKAFEDEIRHWLPLGSVFEVKKITNWDNTDQPIHIEGTLSLPSFATGAAHRMLMPLELFQVSQVSLFASEKRVNAVYFHFPYEEIDDIKLRVPTGYKADSVPPERKIDLGAASYDFLVVPQDNSVEVKRHLVLNGVLFPKEAYPRLRSFFGTVKTNDNTQLLLQVGQSAKNN